ncbi:MAG: hypothetical protein K6F34_05660, partial [Lachnospiraceae bacterium]|nr:hypothetical protein [Lachnospiraceae bacterium]
MFCIKCGNNLVEGSFFCNKCGAPVAGAGSQNNDNTGMRGNVDPAMQGNNGNMQNNVNPGMQMNNWNMQNNAYPNMRSNNRNIPNGANPYMPVNNGYMMPAGDAISKKTVLAILMIIGLFIALLSGIFHIYEEPDSWGEDTYNMFSVVGEYYSSKCVSIGYFGNGAFFSWVFGILFSIASLIGLVFPKVTDESKPGLIRVSSFLFIYSMLMIQIGLFIERITVNSRIYMNAWGWGLL